MQKYLLFLIAAFMLVACKNASNATENMAVDVDDDLDEQWDYSESDFGLYGSLPEGTTEFVGKMGNTPIELAITKFGYDDTLEAAVRIVDDGYSDMYDGESLPAMDGDINFCLRHNPNERQFNLTKNGNKIVGTAYFDGNEFPVVLKPKRRETTVFYDPTFFDLAGPVKTVSVPLNIPKHITFDIRFSDKGRLQSYRESESYCGYTFFADDIFLQRGKHGEIVSLCLMTRDNETRVGNCRLDNDGKLVSYEFWIGEDLSGSNTIRRDVKTFVHQEEVNTEAWELDIATGEGGNTMKRREVYTYTVTKTDSYGNWIERKWTHTGPGRTVAGVDQRIITYYE